MCITEMVAPYGCILAHKRRRNWDTMPYHQWMNKPYHMAEDLAQPAISRVSRRVRQDSLRVFYAENMFVIRECNAHSQFENTLSGLIIWARHMRSAGYASLIKKCVLKLDRKLETVEDYLDSICPGGTSEITLKKIPNKMFKPDEGGHIQEYCVVDLYGRG